MRCRATEVGGRATEVKLGCNRKLALLLGYGLRLGCSRSQCAARVENSQSAAEKMAELASCKVGEIGVHLGWSCVAVVSQSGGLKMGEVWLKNGRDGC